MFHAPPSSSTLRPARERPPMSLRAPPAAFAGGDRSEAALDAPDALGNQALLRAGTARLPTALRPGRTPLLQRKCNCGSTAGISGECTECGEKNESALHRKAIGE